MHSKVLCFSIVMSSLTPGLAVGQAATQSPSTKPAADNGQTPTNQETASTRPAADTLTMLRKEIEKIVGAGRLADGDFGYNPRIRTMGIGFTIQKKDEPLPTETSAAKELTEIMRCVRNSGVAVDLLEIEAYGYNDNDHDTDLALIEGAWKVAAVKEILTKNPELRDMMSLCVYGGNVNRLSKN
jgi:hypothetical protein